MGRIAEGEAFRHVFLCDLSPSPLPPVTFHFRMQNKSQSTPLLRIVLHTLHGNKVLSWILR